MNRPVSSETRAWRSLQIFNAYRLIQMLLLVVMVRFSIDTITRHPFDMRLLVVFVGCLHLALIAVGCLLSWRWKRHFHAQLSAQMAIDAICVTALMFGADGIKSSFGGILLVSVAGASLMVSKKYLAMFYAALATLAILVMELLSYFTFTLSEMVSFAQGGFLGLAFFGAAYAAYFSGNRLSLNEELAWRRGIALDDQVRISRRIMERMRDGVLVVDAGGYVVDHNPVALAILGRDPEQGKDFLATIDPDLARSYQEWQDGDGVGEVEIHRPDGVDIAVSFARTYCSSGVALAFLRDLHKLREQALQLKLASLGRLTASIAHEIRNPLSSIRHARDFLAEDTRDPGQQRLLRIIDDNVLRLDRIVQDVLVLGRQQSTEQREIVLADFLADFIQEVGARENLPAGMIACEAPEDARLRFNPGQFHQVLWNLVGNALRYASRNPGAIRLVVENTEDSVKLHISDDGPGIPNDLHARIFEPFFTTSSKGSGLGLHIVRELCEANGVMLFLAPGESSNHFILKGKEAPWTTSATPEK
ncbi:MAG: PAS domain-containing protein [Zoogloeaceae bacterium]|nr:PAS domain-containing protein [Zoogloeaceae bacterium]